jgi:hypothetical protein
LDLENDEDFAGDYYTEAGIFDQMWFNKEFSPDIHGNGLPVSLEKLKGVNHLKYLAIGAFSKSQTKADNFRVCLWLAPFVKATFLSPGILLDLGFAASQFGEQMTKQQITVVNSEAAFVEFTGLTAPKIDLTSKCTVNLYPAELLATSFVHLLKISAKKCSMQKFKIAPMSSTSMFLFNLMRVSKNFNLCFPPVPKFHSLCFAKTRIVFANGLFLFQRHRQKFSCQGGSRCSDRQRG